MAYEPSLDAVSRAVGNDGLKTVFIQGLETAHISMSAFILVAILISFLRGNPAVIETIIDRDSQMPYKV